jgi:hypothetical protein
LNTGSPMEMSGIAEGQLVAPAGQNDRFIHFSFPVQKKCGYNCVSLET